MKKEKLQEPENKETWLNRLEKFMTNSTFEFRTTDLLFRCHLEQKDFNSDWATRKCFVVRMFIIKWPCKDLLVREAWLENPIFSIDDAINQVNKFFENNFFSNNISPF